MLILLSSCISDNIFDYMQPNRKEFPLSQDYLEEKDDGLSMRSSGDYAEDKLRILEAYIHIFIVSMRNKQWPAINYVDLQAGPGKNIFGSNKVKFGSPLIALTAPYPFTNYWFVEQGNAEFSALNKRVAVSPHAAKVKMLQGDCNIVVDSIIDEIRAIDKKPKTGDKWSNSLNLAFLDPEGLELNWKTVEKLGSLAKMDLIINFSTSGFTRNADAVLEKENQTRLDTFFGTFEWRSVYEAVADKDSSIVRRTMIDFYRRRLEQLGYIYSEDLVEKVFKNSRGRQLYTLIAASKHDLGHDFWDKATN
jgi:three-Cys-motif partner protein